MSTLLDGYMRFMACQHLSAKKRKSDRDCNRIKTKSFVTISRQTGAGGTTIGKKLEAYLVSKESKVSEEDCPWTFFDKNIISRVLEEHNLPEDIAKYLSEEKSSEIKDLIDTFFSLHSPNFVLVKKVSETILHLAQMGHVILVGRGGNVVTSKIAKGVHIRLIGSVEKRVLHAQEFYGLDAQEAAKLVKKEDQGRKDYLKQNFNKDIDDALLYDLVINTDQINHEQAAKMIGDLVLSRQDS